jgi:chromosome segregation ATPase
MNEILTCNGVAEEAFSSLKNEKDELACTLEQEKADALRLEAGKAEADLKIETLNSTIAELLSTNAQLVQDIEMSKLELNELSSRTEKFQALEHEVGDYSNQLRCVTDENIELSTKMAEEETKWKNVVADLERSLNKQSLEINQLNGQLHSIISEATRPPPPEDDLESDNIESLKNEIIDLKSLLASANASVDEARIAALSADRELEEKELQLENALGSVAEHDEARRIAEEKLRKMELSCKPNSAKGDSEEELLRDMECKFEYVRYSFIRRQSHQHHQTRHYFAVLMEEKIEAESRLERELSRRKEVEDEIKRATEEEKQLLMDEAEDKMISLRDEISQLKSDLSRVESECYSRKDENADLLDKIARVESRAADSESLVTSIRDELSKEQTEKICVQKKLRSLEEQSAAFKLQVFDAKAFFEADAHARLTDIGEQLNRALDQLSESKKEVKLSRETISDLNSDIDQYKKEIDSIKCMASNENGMEVSKLKEELAQTKLDLYHSEADCLSAKRELESAREKVDSVMRHEHEKQKKFAAKAKEAIETLKDRLAKAESTPNASKVVDDLQAKMKELTQTLRDKEERIKKLEKSKITKSQISNIQKLKVCCVLMLVVSPPLIHRWRILLTCIFMNHSNILSLRMKEVNSWPKRKNTSSGWKNSNNLNHVARAYVKGQMLLMINLK